ncbi:MAG: phosphatase PAP2 family protein [Ignavibacteriaceae bacterium]|nr:phosphatase PAP2 family protein [Ignavibacteriaceae bacterium]
MKYFLFFLITLTSAFPQRENRFNDFFTVGKDLIKAPGNFNKDDAAISIGVAGLTAAASLLDPELKSFSQSNKTDFLDAIFGIDEYYHIETMAISTAGLFIYGAVSKDNDLTNLGLRLSEATIYTGAATLMIKVLTGRTRPSSSNDNLEFNPINFSWEQTSFPSGHSSLAFSFSTVMAFEKDGFFWRAGWYSLAFLTSIARVYNNAHWFSDIVFGAMLGYFIGKFVSEHHTNKISNQWTNPQTTFPLINFRYSL